MKKWFCIEKNSSSFLGVYADLVALRARHTFGTTNGTAKGTAILDGFCGCAVALDARRWKCFSET